MAQYVFGYGSLTARPGLVLTRELKEHGFVADLTGLCRTWGMAMDNRRDLPGYKRSAPGRLRRLPGPGRRAPGPGREGQRPVSAGGWRRARAARSARAQ